MQLSFTELRSLSRYFNTSLDCLKKCEEYIELLKENLGINSSECIESWKIHNIICDIDKYYIRLYEAFPAQVAHALSPEKDQDTLYWLLTKSETNCQAYLTAVNKEHPYALRVYARQCIAWAKYYKNHGDPASYANWIKDGFEYCDLAESRSNSSLCRHERNNLEQLRRGNDCLRDEFL